MIKEKIKYHYIKKLLKIEEKHKKKYKDKRMSVKELDNLCED